MVVEENERGWGRKEGKVQVAHVWLNLFLCSIIYSVLIPDVQQSNSVTHLSIYSFTDSFPLHYYKTLILMSLLSILYTAVCMC